VTPDELAMAHADLNYYRNRKAHLDAVRIETMEKLAFVRREIAKLEKQIADHHYQGKLFDEQDEPPAQQG